MASLYWLVKQEPESYAWEAFVNDGSTVWTGVRNYQARNYLRSMKKGDLVFYYHSVKAREIVGLARVTKEHYPDPSAEEGDWSVVELEPVKPLKVRVSLAQIKAEPELKEMVLVRNSRLSVMPIKPEEFRHILSMAKTLMPRLG